MYLSDSYTLTFLLIVTLCAFIVILDFRTKQKMGTINNFSTKIPYITISSVSILLSILSLIKDGARFIEYMESKYLIFDFLYTTPTEMWLRAVIAAAPLIIIIIGSGYILYRICIKPIKVNQMVFIPSRTTHKSHREKIEEQ